MAFQTDMSATNEMLSGGLNSQALEQEEDEPGGADSWMSPRQVKLNWLWSLYRCEQYEKCRVDWNGQENVPKTEHEFIATSGFVPAGFYDAGDTLPIKFKKPTAPVHLVKVIVARFTGLLFSARRHPAVQIREDKRTTEWLSAALEQGRFWAHMQMARNYGGAVGSAAVGFKIVRGKVQFEVFDPRFCTPDFSDKSTGELDSLEFRHQYDKELRVNGERVLTKFWYRRVINDTSDTIWKAVPVSDVEPNWDDHRSRSVEHGLGECPVQWVQNKEVQSDMDGDPDCHGVYDLCWSVDALWAQSHTSTIKNCDPTVSITSDAEFQEIRKGSGNALQVEMGGNISYMEMTGAGVTKAMELAEKLEDRIQLVARCRIDAGSTKSTGPTTATEIELQYSSMLEEADVLREQYGEKCVKPLLEKLVRAARKMASGTIDRSGGTPRIVVRKIALPKKAVVDPKTGETTGWCERELGDGETVELRWPPYFTPTIEDAGKAVKAASDAKASGIVDRANAIELISPYFQIDDMNAMIRKIEQEEKTEAAQMEAKMHEQLNSPFGG